LSPSIYHLIQTVSLLFWAYLHIQLFLISLLLGLFTTLTPNLLQALLPLSLSRFTHLHLCRSSIRPSLTTESLTSLQFATPKGEVSDSDSPIATPITPMLPSLMFPQGLSTKPVTSPTYPPHDRECSHCHCN
jgi:hypothetical protein